MTSPARFAVSSTERHAHAPRVATIDSGVEFWFASTDSANGSKRFVYAPASARLAIDSGVMVVGPALPQVSFEQELLKRYYDDQYGAGFEFAYLIPGMTRVVQSAGRVIRSESDIGIIALLCRRFTQETYTRYFPSDWYEESPRELISRKPASEIRAFFEAKATPQLRLV